MFSPEEDASRMTLARLAASNCKCDFVKAKDHVGECEEAQEILLAREEQDSSAAQ